MERQQGFERCSVVCFVEVNPFTDTRRVFLASAMNGMMTWAVPNRTRAMRHCGIAEKKKKRTKTHTRMASNGRKKW